MANQRGSNELWLFGVDNVEIKLRESDVYYSSLTLRFPCGQSKSQVSMTFDTKEDQDTTIQQLIAELSQHLPMH